MLGSISCCSTIELCELGEGQVAAADREPRVAGKESGSDAVTGPSHASHRQLVAVVACAVVGGGAQPHPTGSTLFNLARTEKHCTWDLL